MEEGSTDRGSQSSAKPEKSAVFFDRDGTLIEDARYLVDASRIQIVPGAVDAVRKVNQAGLEAIVITNQSAVARGLLSERGLAAIHQRVSDLFRRGGAVLDAFYSCVHHPDFPSSGQSGPCRCRKPEPGLLLQAARERKLRLGSSFLIGDRLRDVLAGRRAGCRCVLVKTGSGTEEALRLEKAPQAGRVPEHVASDVLDAVDWILERLND